MYLLNGVTGFSDEKGNPAPTVDGKQFKKICFALVRENGGEVLSFGEPKVATNFYKVNVKIFDVYFYILLNSSYPFIAFASSVEYGSIRFVDNQHLARLFSSFYCVLSSVELNETVVFKKVRGKVILSNDNALNDAELHELFYWKPRRVGDVIFNFWD